MPVPKSEAKPVSPLSRREFLKAGALGLAGLVAVPKIDFLSRGLNHESLGLPGQWPETAAEAATLFGGIDHYWRRDLYVLDGQTKWDGAWVMEAYNLKTPFQTDGSYTDASGKPMNADQIHDFNSNPAKVDVNFGSYAQNYQAHGTAWDTKQYWAGYGTAVFDDAVQAVVRPIVIECPIGQTQEEVLAAYQDEAWKRTAQEFSKFLFYDANADNIIAGLWSQEKQQFKLVQGKGWKS